MISQNDGWILSLKGELDKLGLAYLWDYAVSDTITYKIIEQRTTDVYKQELFFSNHAIIKGITVLVYG